MNSHINLAITMGDPAGIGPEIAIKSLSGDEIPPDCHIFIIGDLSVINQAKKYTGSSVNTYSMSSPNDFQAGSINVLDMQQIKPDDFTIGTVNKKCGRASYAYILKGISLAKEGLIDGVVTNPINKAALKKTGINFPGHTEIFAHETKSDNFSMVFMLDNVYVIYVTTHCSLREAIDRITQDLVYKKILLLKNTLNSLGFENPIIAVGGLNPHAGENGIFGNEERLHITPAIEQAQEKSITVLGPLPPDTVFMRAFKGEFHGIVSMLHDHGFVALKSKDFEHGVNITVGLPIIRTSVGHGTAFDIAGTGKASEKSLLAAIDAAYRMSQRKRIGVLKD